MLTVNNPEATHYIEVKAHDKVVNRIPYASEEQANKFLHHLVATFWNYAAVIERSRRDRQMLGRVKLDIYGSVTIYSLIEGGIID